jgi:hypothetical protein
MNNRYFLALAAGLLLVACILPVSADTDTAGVEQGWFVIHCNVYGAKVYIDDKYVGTIQQGPLSIQVATNVSYKTIRVQKIGYSTFTDAIASVPEKGESVDLYATLNAVAEANQTTSSTDKDVGWYVVHCNIDGATVLFDGTNRGEISQGLLYIPMYSAGEPYQKFTVKKDGYTTFTDDIADVPQKGETIDLYATLNPAPSGATAATATTPATGGNIGWYRVHCNVNGSTVSFDNNPVGQIAEGTLSVRVNLSATPAKTFTVFKSGYLPYTGTIDQSPEKGGTIELYATLNTDQAGNSTVPVTRKSPIPAGTCITALVAVAGMVLASRK